MMHTPLSAPRGFILMAAFWHCDFVLLQLATFDIMVGCLSFSESQFGPNNLDGTLEPQESGEKLAIDIVFVTSQKSSHRFRLGPFPLKRVVSALIISIVGTIPACTYLPSSGPSDARIKEHAGTSYDLIPITSEVVRIIRERSTALKWTAVGGEAAVPHSSRMGRAGPNFRFSLPGVDRLPVAAPQAISVGDVVSVWIYETGSGLFGPAGAGTLKGNPTGGTGASGNQLPPQTVDASGEITVPYAGRVFVKDRAPHSVEEDIAKKLKGKAIDPQVIVTVADRTGGSLVTVTGDVKQPREIPLGFAGTRLLDAVTAAGGSIGKAHETLVSVIRGSALSSESLTEITNNPSKNVRLQPGDTVAVQHRPRTYLAFGATGRNGRVTFDTDQVSLAEAVAQAGGLLDGRANPSAVYLYRMEPRSLVKKLGHNPKEFVGGRAPVIYNLDLLSPKGFFLARNFDVQDKDIIYFANARSVGLSKFLALIGQVTSGVAAPASAVSVLSSP